MSQQVTVRYYAAARELSGCDEEAVVLPRPELSASELLQLLAQLHPPLAPYLTRMRVAVNDELRLGDARVRGGDVVDVMPPVAGGSAGPDFGWVELDAGRGRVRLSDAALSLDEAISVVRHPSAGGIAMFLGVVRDHAAGRAVSRLDYEAHATLANRELAKVANEVLVENPAVRVCAVHRVGSLQVGDAAVVVAASAPHRAEAFSACRELIERLKERVPIWKKEWGADGSAGWVNLDG